MKSKKRRKHLKLHEISLEQDIRYRGPLSYRHLKIAGWICLAIAQVLVLITLFNNLRPGAVTLSPIVSFVLMMFGSLPIPLFILSNFSQILDSDKGYKTLLLSNGLAAAGIIILFLFLYMRYAVGLAGALFGDKTIGMQSLNQLLALLTKNNGAAFNFFVDFFLCTLVMFFLNYRPKRFFTGKKVRIFRCFIAFPILYEIAALILKYLAASEILIMPAVLFPFLPTKPLLMFLVFLVLAIFIKNRERQFCKNDRIHEEYLAFLETNRNSLHFSIFAAIVFVIAGLIDVILFSILSNVHLEGQAQTIAVIRSLGLGGGTSGLLLLAPFTLLFSYTRKHKSYLPDLIIPAVGIMLIVLVYLEGIFQAVITLLAG